jgi:hypothetical protein
MDDIIEVTVSHYFNYPIYFPFMTEKLFELFQDAVIHHEETAIVPKEEFDQMIKGYFDTLWN